MKLFNKPFGDYLQSTKTGIGLLFVVSVVRFLMKPAFGVAYAQGTNLASVTILLPIVMAVYAVKAARSGGTFRDLLGVAAALCWSTTVFIMLGIAVSTFGGIDTYYIDPEHGGDVNAWLHMGGHILFSGVIFTLVMWGLGSLVFVLAGGSRKRAVA